MAIQITGATTQLDVTFDKVFMESFELVQVRDREDGNTPVINLEYKYRIYGVDADGLRHYKDMVHSITVKDILPKIAGKPARVAVLQAIEAGLADMLTDSDAIDTASVV